MLKLLRSFFKAVIGVGKEEEDPDPTPYPGMFDDISTVLSLSQNLQDIFNFVLMASSKDSFPATGVGQSSALWFIGFEKTRLPMLLSAIDNLCSKQLMLGQYRFAFISALQNLQKSILEAQKDYVSTKPNDLKFWTKNKTLSVSCGNAFSAGQAYINDLHGNSLSKQVEHFTRIASQTDFQRFLHKNLSYFEDGVSAYMIKNDLTDKENLEPLKNLITVPGPSSKEIDCHVGYPEMFDDVSTFYYNAQTLCTILDVIADNMNQPVGEYGITWMTDPTYGFKHVMLPPLNDAFERINKNFFKTPDWLNAINGSYDTIKTAFDTILNTSDAELNDFPFYENKDIQEIPSILNVAFSPIEKNGPLSGPKKGLESSFPSLAKQLIYSDYTYRKAKEDPRKDPTDLLPDMYNAIKLTGLSSEALYEQFRGMLPPNKTDGKNCK